MNLVWSWNWLLIADPRRTGVPFIATVWMVVMILRRLCLHCQGNRLLSARLHVEWCDPGTTPTTRQSATALISKVCEVCFSCLAAEPQFQSRAVQCSYLKWKFFSRTKINLGDLRDPNTAFKFEAKRWIDTANNYKSQIGTKLLSQLES